MAEAALGAPIQSPPSPNRDGRINGRLRSIGRFVFGKMMPRAAYPVVRGPLRGTKLILGSIAGEGGGSSAYFNLLEAAQTRSFAGNVRRDDVVFDIGANVGYYSLLGSLLAGPKGRVVAIEPSVSNISLLNRHILINKIKNIMIVTAACSDAVGLAAFREGENNATGSLAGCGGGRGGETTIVPTVTVDALVERLGITPHAMKIDVEGAEVLILKGARATIASARPRIFLSVHSDSLKDECLGFLGRFGYTFTPLTEGPAESASEFLAVPG